MVSKKFYVGSFIGAYILGILFLFISSIQAKHGNINSALKFSSLFIICGLYIVVIMIVLWYKAWKAIQDEYARMTPVKAIIFSFIPIFNIYWMYQLIYGFAKDYNKYIQRHNINVQLLPENLFLLHYLFTIGLGSFSFLISKKMIAFKGLYYLLLLMDFVIRLLVISKICDAINNIALKYEMD